jgi:Rieske Fe-S protein
VNTPTTPKALSRRTLITAGGVTVMSAGALVLTACTSSGSTGASGGSGGAAGAGAPPIAAGTEVVTLSSIPVGGTATATVDGVPVVLSRPTSGSVVCFSAVCTHQGCLVNAAATEFDCPCHGSRFAAATGAVLNGPASTPLPKIAVKISGDSVVIA